MTTQKRQRWPTYMSVWIVLSSAMGLSILLLANAVLFLLSLVLGELDARAQVAKSLADLFGNLPLVGNVLSGLAGDLEISQWFETNLNASSFVLGIVLGFSRSTISRIK